MTAQTAKERVRRINVRRRECEKSTDMPLHLIEEPTASHIGEQRNGDFRHTNAGALTHNSVTTPCENAQTPAHDHTMPPTNEGLGISMQQIVHSVFASKEMLGIIAGAPRRFQRGIAECLDITPGAKSLLSCAIDQHSHHLLITGPVR